CRPLRPAPFPYTTLFRSKSLDRGGFTPLLYAARENCRECADILVRHGADLNLADPGGVSPLVIALINGNFDIAKRLIEAGADVRSEEHMSALQSRENLVC